MGIGSDNPTGDLSQHVLGKFHPSELKAVDELVEEAACAAMAALRGDLDIAMNKYNKQ